MVTDSSAFLMHHNLSDLESLILIQITDPKGKHYKIPEWCYFREVDFPEQ